MTTGDEGGEDKVNFDVGLLGIGEFDQAMKQEMPVKYFKDFLNSYKSEEMS